MTDFGYNKLSITMQNNIYDNFFYVVTGNESGTRREVYYGDSTININGNANANRDANAINVVRDNNFVVPGTTGDANK